MDKETARKFVKRLKLCYYDLSFEQIELEQEIQIIKQEQYVIKCIIEKYSLKNNVNKTDEGLRENGGRSGVKSKI